MNRLVALSLFVLATAACGPPVKVPPPTKQYAPPPPSKSDDGAGSGSASPSDAPPGDTKVPEPASGK